MSLLDSLIAYILIGIVVNIVFGIVEIIKSRGDDLAVNPAWAFSLVFWPVLLVLGVIGVIYEIYASR